MYKKTAKQTPFFTSVYKNDRWRQLTNLSDQYNSCKLLHHIFINIIIKSTDICDIRCNLQLRQLMNVTQVNRIISKFSCHIYWFSVPSTHITHNAYLLIFSHKHPCIPQFISIDFSGKHPCIPRCIFIDFKCRALMYPMVYIYWFSMPSTHISHGIYLLVFSAEHSRISGCISFDFQTQVPVHQIWNK